VGALDDGTAGREVYPVLGRDAGATTKRLIPTGISSSEFVPGTFADYIVRAETQRDSSAQPHPGTPRLGAGTAWLTAYRTLFTNPGCGPGRRCSCRDRREAWRRRLIQLGRAAGFEVWTTSRNEEGRALAETARPRIGTFTSNEKLPHKVQAVVR